MNAEYTLLAALEADTATMALLSSIGVNKCIAVAMKDPSTWPVDGTTLSIYNAVGVNNSVPWSPVELTVNCRAANEVATKALVAAVVEAVNRVPISGGGHWICQTLFLIRPEDGADAYNMPITITAVAGREIN